jgi:riboflavin synthase
MARVRRLLFLLLRGIHALMFTGIVQHLARITGVQQEGPGKRLEIECAEIAVASRLGDSVAVNGCCLTTVQQSDRKLVFQAGEETLSRTNLGELTVDSRVNLETSLRVGDPLGGHLVTGHIDGVGTVLQRQEDKDWSKMWISFPSRHAGELVQKGSIAVDGVSLTLVDVQQDQFSVALIPHTLKVTTLGSRRPGDHVNLETDILGKYVARQLALKTIE